MSQAIEGLWDDYLNDQELMEVCEVTEAMADDISDTSTYFSGGHYVQGGWNGHEPPLMVDVASWLDDVLWRSSQDIFDKWQAQPQDQYQMEEYERDMRYVFEEEPFVSTYWSNALVEQEYLGAVWSYYQHTL